MAESDITDHLQEEANPAGELAVPSPVSNPVLSPVHNPGLNPVQIPVRKRLKPGERRVQILQMLATMLQQPNAPRVTTAALAAQLDVSEAALYRHFASKAQMFEGLIEFIEQSVFTLVNLIGEREGTATSNSNSNSNSNNANAADAKGAVSAAAHGALGSAPLSASPDVLPSALPSALASSLTGGSSRISSGDRHAGKLVVMLIQFAEKNPGMARVMVGDALVFEHERLQQRMNLFFDKFEATLKQVLRDAQPEPGSASPSADAQAKASVMTAFVMGRLQRYVRSDFRRAPSELLDASLSRMR